MDFLLFSNLFIAGAAALMTLESERLLTGGDRLWAVVGLVFFATLLVYNLDRLTGGGREDRAQRSRRHQWVAEHRRLLWAMAAGAAAGAVGCLAFLPPRVWWWLAPLMALTGAYSLRTPGATPLGRPGRLGRLSRLGRFRLKQVAGLKVFLVAAVWAGATVWLPAVGRAGPLPFHRAVGGLAVERFAFLVAITLPFDVRDVQRDAAAGIRTLPMMIGVRGVRRLALASITLFALVSVVQFASAGRGQALALALSAAQTAGLIALVRPDRGDYYYLLLLDGTMVVQYLLVRLL